MCTFNAHTIMDVAEMPNWFLKMCSWMLSHLVCDGLKVCVHSMYSGAAADIAQLILCVCVGNKYVLTSML